MSNYWCVNFMDSECLAHGLREKLWMMGYQYDEGKDSAQWNAACTANWRILQEIDVGDELVAYAPRNGLERSPRGSGYAFLATGRVRAPRRPFSTRDARDTIENYISHAEAYDRGYVYLDSSVVYENFTDEYKNLPARIDVEGWDNHFSEAILLSLDLPRNKTVRAAFRIDKNTFDQIARKLAEKRGSNRRSRRK